MGKNSSSSPPSPQEYQNWLSLLRDTLGCATRACLVTFSEPNGTIESDLHLPGNKNNEDLIRLCTRVRKENKGVILLSGSDNDTPVTAHIGSPVATSGRLNVYSFEIRVETKQHASKVMFQLECGLRLLVQRLKATQAEIQADAGKISSITELAASTQGTSNFSLAVQHYIDTLCGMLDAERVSFGIWKKERAKLTSISQQSSVEKNSTLVRDITLAMEECCDQGQPVRHPARGTTPGPVNLLHKTLCENHGSALAFSIPLDDGPKDTFFVLLVECREENQFTAAKEQLLASIAKLTGPIFTAKMVQEQSLTTTLITEWQKRIAHLQTKKRTTLLTTLPILLCFLFVFFVKGEFRIPADVELTGNILRSIVAPFPGYIASSEQSAGDEVAAGQILATLDTSDLTLEELTWSSKYAQADLEYRQAIAHNSTSQAKIITQQKKQAEIQLSLLQLQKERAVIKAPFAGTIVSGDLSQAVGGPVERGKLLFEMIPEGGYRILAQVDEGDICYLEKGQQGSLVFNSLPGETFRFSVTKVTPVSKAAEGKNSFRVEAKLLDAGSRLRPGMQGYGKIRVGSKPLIWLWSRPLRNRLRLLSWTLLP